MTIRRLLLIRPVTQLGSGHLTWAVIALVGHHVRGRRCVSGRGVGTPLVRVRTCARLLVVEMALARLTPARPTDGEYLEAYLV